MLNSKENQWHSFYSSPPDNINEAFFFPALSSCSTYDRAIGRWSSSKLASLAEPLDEFVMNSGKMRLVVSPDLTEDEFKAISDAETKIERFKSSIADEIRGPIPDDVKVDHLRLLTWMLANSHLEIKVGVSKFGGGYAPIDDQIGIFKDSSGNAIAFRDDAKNYHVSGCGASNSFIAFKNWGAEFEISVSQDLTNRFSELWENKEANYSTWDASEWLSSELASTWGSRSPRKTRVSNKPLSFLGQNSQPSIPVKLHKYQRHAIDNWLEAKGRGIFAMATGTGKTFTALAAAVDILKNPDFKSQPLLTLVIVPSIDLVKQWESNATQFNFKPAKFHSGTTNNEKDKALRTFNEAQLTIPGIYPMVITTAQSLASNSKLQRLLSSHADNPIMVIGDEMHSLGTPRGLASLPKEPTFTLGLSATPNRHQDDVGTKELFRYFGDPVYSIGIKEAIEKGALVEYEYDIITVELTDEEAQKYRHFSKMIATAMANSNEKQADHYKRERSRLIQHASGKLAALRELMKKGLCEKHYQFIYAAEGKSSDDDDQRLMVRIKEILYHEFGIRLECYFGETSSEQRSLLITNFTRKNIHGLIAMKCLDEGVDIPPARIGIIMASTQNPRQFVQRRGRLLRKSPETRKTHAELYDFLVLPPKQHDQLRSEINLIGNELARAFELADAARNPGAKYKIRELGIEYGLPEDQFPWVQSGHSLETLR